MQQFKKLIKQLSRGAEIQIQLHLVNQVDKTTSNLLTKPPSVDLM